MRHLDTGHQRDTACCSRHFRFPVTWEPAVDQSQFAAKSRQNFSLPTITSNLGERFGQKQANSSCQVRKRQLRQKGRASGRHHPGRGLHAAAEPAMRPASPVHTASGWPVGKWGQGQGRARVTTGTYHFVVYRVQIVRYWLPRPRHVATQRR